MLPPQPDAADVQPGDGLNGSTMFVFRDVSLRISDLNAGNDANELSLRHNMSFGRQTAICVFCGAAVTRRS